MKDNRKWKDRKRQVCGEKGSGKMKDYRKKGKKYRKVRGRMKDNRKWKDRKKAGRWGKKLRKNERL